MSDGLPVESFWTAATAAFEYRTISCNFSDPGVPAALRPVIQVVMFLPPHLPGQCTSHKPMGDWRAPISGAGFVSACRVMLTRTHLLHKSNPSLIAW